MPLFLSNPRYAPTHQPPPHTTPTTRYYCSNMGDIGQSLLTSITRFYCSNMGDIRHSLLGGAGYYTERLCLPQVPRPLRTNVQTLKALGSRSILVLLRVLRLTGLHLPPRTSQSKYRHTKKSKSPHATAAALRVSLLKSMQQHKLFSASVARSSSARLAAFPPIHGARNKWVAGGSISLLIPASQEMITTIADKTIGSCKIVSYGEKQG